MWYNVSYKSKGTCKYGHAGIAQICAIFCIIILQEWYMYTSDIKNQYSVNIAIEKNEGI